MQRILLKSGYPVSYGYREEDIKSLAATFDGIYKAYLESGTKGFNFNEKESALQLILTTLPQVVTKQTRQVQSSAVSFLGVMNNEIKHRPGVISDLRLQFINDCMEYLTCKPRKYPIAVWARLLEQDLLAPTKLKAETLKEFTDNAEHYVGDLNNIDLVQSWLTKDGGFGDLVTSLSLLYGVGNAVLKPQI